MKKIVFAVTVGIVLASLVKADVGNWEAAMCEKRPHLPAKETRSPRPENVVTVMKNASLSSESKTVADKTLGNLIPQTAQWRTVFKSEEERIEVCDFTDGDDAVNSFAVYGQLGDFTPYYWKVDGLSGLDAVTIVDFLKNKCSIDDIKKVTYSEDVLSAEEIDVREMGESLAVPYSRFRLFFIDDRPGANWAHPCRYVFVSEDYTSFTVLYKMMPPRIVSRKTSELVHLRRLGDKETESEVPEQLENVKAKVYGYANSLAENSLSYATGDASRSYFILICGGADPESNGIRFWADTAMMYSTLTLKYGVPKSNIYVYMSDGTSSGLDANLGETLVSSPTDLDGDSRSDISGAATKSNVSSCFSSLKSKLTAADQLFVFVTSHGGPDGISSINNRDCIACLFSDDGSAYFRDDELKDWTCEFPCPVAFAIETCYSGGFVDDITQTANRVIGTACNHHESSWGWYGKSVPEYWDGKGYTYASNSWIGEFISALRGKKPSNMTDYGYPWVDSTVTVDADEDNDGLVSFAEACIYANENDEDRCTRSSHSSTCGDDYGTEHPQYAESTSGLGDSFFVLKQSQVHQVDLPTALDNTSLKFTTGGSASWYGQSEYTSDGVDAARSGDISHNQESWMQTTVSGPGTVSFKWFVSSELDYDYLEFLIDDVLKSKISGASSSWASKTFTILTGGTHTLKWRYKKDVSYDEGEDAGFVDKVVWTPAGPVNDNFANATRITGKSGAVSGSTVNATCESGEPLPSYKPAATNTIWWVWTAPVSGKVSFSTEETEFDTVMGVYTGSSVTGLTAISEDDDGGEGLKSLCNFAVVSGVKYYIAVSGYGGSQGTVRLNWNVLPSYIVKFNRMDSSGVTYTQVFSVGVSERLPTLQSMGWSYSGHYFMGWSTRVHNAALEPACVVDYADGAYVKNLASEGKTITLYAVWSSSPLKSIPLISSSASTSTVNATVDGVGFADADVKKVIGGSASVYSAFRTWAQGMTGGEAAVAISPHAAAAYLLGSNKLFGYEPTIILDAAGGANAGGSGLSVVVTVKDGDRVMDVDATKVKSMFEATTDPGDWNGSSKLSTTVTVERDEGTSIRYNVSPINGKPRQMFIRILKNL